MVSARPHRLLTVLCLFGSVVFGRANRDYSKEGFLIENFSRHISFAFDGTWESEQTAAIRVQSDAGVQEFGILSFPYDRDNQDIKVAYLRVKKPDGSMVATPLGDVQDVSSDVSRVAPTYSDLREKQIPVKALGVGDVIEYSVRLIQMKPEIAGQFWYTQNFMTDAVVLSEELEVSVPADKYVQVVSPKFIPEVRTEAGRKVYLWKNAQLEPTVRDQTKATPPSASVPSVQVTTFRSWDEIARWYANLQNERLVVTPAIQAKANQLTEGLSSPTDKEGALYNFVSTKFRYISLSFGVGRYQPHAAEEVLANQYGDCKDKHTLFAALLKAVGIDAWPALIGSGLKLDPTVPSPAQFNHAITVIPNRDGYLWLDTTPEVAPFGLLQASLRDQKALVISPEKAILVNTPADPPFPAAQAINVKAILKPDGTLTGHFEWTLRGDVELLIRSAFHQVPPARWPDLVQGLVQLEGFGGKVSNVVADNPDDLDKPYHYSYDYTRPSYSDWQNHRISPPLPPLLQRLTDDVEPPTEPFFLAAPGGFDYRAEVVLPAGYSAELSPNAKASAAFADFESSYALKDGALEARRRLLIKQSKIAIKDWDAYKKFAGEVSSDHDSMIQLNEQGASNNAEAARLVAEAFKAGQRHDLNSARDYLVQAERLNPKQLGLWSAYAGLDLSLEEPNKAADALEKEIQFHPDNVYAYRLLAYVQGHLNKHDQEIQTLRKLLAVAPANEEAASSLAGLLMKEKRYAEVSGVLQPIIDSGNGRSLRGLLGDALLKSGNNAEGIAVLEKYAEDGDATALNDAAYYLADNHAELAMARQYAEKAVSEHEEETKKLALPWPKDSDLKLINSLSSAWDTLGWVCYQMGDFAEAEKYLIAAWSLSQRGIVADHLGQTYLKLGKRQAAIHTWQLALAADRSLDETRERLRKMGASATPVHSVKFVSPDEELGRLRTAGVSSLPKQQGSAEFFVLLSSSGVEDSQFISGSESLKSAGRALKQSELKAPLPDDNGEKVIRRGILSCSSYTTPSCQFVLLLPSTTQSVSRPSN